MHSVLLPCVLSMLMLLMGNLVNCRASEAKNRRQERWPIPGKPLSRSRNPAPAPAPALARTGNRWVKSALWKWTSNTSPPLSYVLPLSLHYTTLHWLHYTTLKEKLLGWRVTEVLWISVNFISTRQNSLGSTQFPTLFPNESLLFVVSTGGLHPTPTSILIFKLSSFWAF